MKIILVDTKIPRRDKLIEFFKKLVKAGQIGSCYSVIPSDWPADQDNRSERIRGELDVRTRNVLFIHHSDWNTDDVVRFLQADKNNAIFRAFIFSEEPKKISRDVNWNKLRLIQIPIVNQKGYPLTRADEEYIIRELQE